MPNINCQHNLAAEFTDTEALEHFNECLDQQEKVAQLLQWRTAAWKWWNSPAEDAGNLPDDGDVQDGKAYTVYEAADMFVLVVLPDFTSLTCGESAPVDERFMETFSSRDLAVMLTLLRAAEQEIITAQGKANDRAMRGRYGEPYGYPAPMPMGVPAPAQVPQP